LTTCYLWTLPLRQSHRQSIASSRILYYGHSTQYSHLVMVALCNRADHYFRLVSIHCVAPGLDAGVMYKCPAPAVVPCDSTAFLLKSVSIWWSFGQEYTATLLTHSRAYPCSSFCVHLTVWYKCLIHAQQPSARTSSHGVFGSIYLKRANPSRMGRTCVLIVCQSSSAGVDATPSLWHSTCQLGCTAVEDPRRKYRLYNVRLCSLAPGSALFLSSPFSPSPSSPRPFPALSFLRSSHCFSPLASFSLLQTDGRLTWIYSKY